MCCRRTLACEKCGSYNIGPEPHYVTRCYARYVPEDVSIYKVLTKEEEITVFTQSANRRRGCPPADDSCNLRLVVSVARQFERQGLHILILSKGNIGLMRAVERFDPDME